MKMNKALTTRVRKCVCAVLVMTLALPLVSCGENKEEPLQLPSDPTSAATSIETAYATLEFPQELFDDLRHTEVIDGDVVMEMFFMETAAGERELYRIYYADPQMGTLAGYLQTESGEISVSYSMSQYDDSVFETEEERRLYYSMMDAFSVIMNSIDSDERFSESRPQAAVGQREVKLRYWTITLPDNIQCEENDVNGTYQVNFYGEVSGERINLYMIGLGQMEADTTLGMYSVDGEQKPVTVSSVNLDLYESWPQEEQTKISKMMDSLNTVIQVIVSDENFV